jgi:formylglycine-generating enzyme required for sulfatase activity
MVGNVLVWCLDGWAPDFYKTAPRIDPAWLPPADKENVLRSCRGASWHDSVAIGSLANAAAQHRSVRVPVTGYEEVGIRLVLNPESR